MTPRKEDENQRIRDERREKILEAASRVFARKGLSATRIADIAAAADMSHGLVYHYFSSKDEVFAVLVERAMTGAVMVTQGAFEQPGTPWDQIRWMASAMLMGVHYQPEYFLVVLQALTSEAVPQAVREKAWQQGRISNEAMTRVIQAGQASGEVVAGDPAQLGTLFYACIQGLAVSMAYGTHTKVPSFPDVDQVLRILKA